MEEVGRIVDIKAWKKALKPATIKAKKKTNWLGVDIDDGKQKYYNATKKDGKKTKMHLLPPKALEGIAKIMTYGATKYNAYNYKQGKGLNWDRVYSACMRHLNAWNSGEDIDPESGENHLLHAGCCIMMLIDLVESKIGKDTRFGAN